MLANTFQDAMSKTPKQNANKQEGCTAHMRSPFSAPTQQAWHTTGQTQHDTCASPAASPQHTNSLNCTFSPQRSQTAGRPAPPSASSCRPAPDALQARPGNDNNSNKPGPCLQKPAGRAHRTPTAGAKAACSFNRPSGAVWWAPTPAALHCSSITCWVQLGRVHTSQRTAHSHPRKQRMQRPMQTLMDSAGRHPLQAHSSSFRNSSAGCPIGRNSPTYNQQACQAPRQMTAGSSQQQAAAGRSCRCWKLLLLLQARPCTCCDTEVHAAAAGRHWLSARPSNGSRRAHAGAPHRSVQTRQGRLLGCDVHAHKLP